MFSATRFSLLLALMVTGWVLPGTGLSADRTLPSKPNIIYILVDDMGYGDLGCYGQRQIQTPRLDRMAAEGMRYTQYYAGCTVCAPSRCVLMTGLHTGHALIRGNREIKPMGQWPLPPETVTVAEVLKEAGYRTGLIGKWGLGGPDTTGVPNRQGFDFFYGYLCQRHAHNYYPEFLFRNGERESLAGNVVDNGREDGAGFAEERALYSHDLCASEAMEFVRRNASKPFFLYLSLTIPHANNEGGKLGMEVPELGAYKDLAWPEAQKGHAAMITRLDRDIGRLLDLLEELKIDKNTVVFFTSDNGPHREGGNDPDFNDSNGPLRGIKRDLYEGGIRVPLMVRWPGVVPEGSLSRHQAYFGDFMATAAELAGVRPPSGLDSLSFVPSFAGHRDQPAHDFLYWEFHGGGSHFRAARSGDWKGIEFYDGRFELFHLGSDLGETRDLSKIHPEQTQRLKAILEAAHVDDPMWPVKRK